MSPPVADHVATIDSTGKCERVSWDSSDFVREPSGNGTASNIPWYNPFTVATLRNKFDEFLAQNKADFQSVHVEMDLPEAPRLSSPFDHTSIRRGILTDDDDAAGLRGGDRIYARPFWQTSVGLIASANVACALSRGAMVVSGFPMAEQFGWNDGFTGVVQSGFFLGFTLSSFGGGYLAARIKPEALLALTVAGTSLFTALTPLAAHLSNRDGSIALPAVRALTGLCEGLIYPSIQGLVSARVRKENKARSLALCYSGAEMGNVLSLTASPAIINSCGWSSTFHLFSFCGLVWLAAWKKLLDSEQRAPADADPAASAAAPAVYSSYCEEVDSLSLVEMFSSRAYRAAVASHASYQLGNLMLLSWMPTFFCQEFGVDLCHGSAYSILPWVFSIATTNASGFLADKVVGTGGFTALQTRKAMQIVASGGPALCLLSLVANSGTLTAPEAMLTMTAITSMAHFKAGGYGPNFMELSPRHASVLCGTSTSIASLVGTAGIMGTGAVLENLHSWPLVFGGIAAIHVASLGIFLKDASAELQFIKLETGGRK
jgi:ACS family sodium-dependent inorganic phosphate cotransporter